MIEPVTGGIAQLDCAGWAGAIPSAIGHSIGDMDGELALAVQYVAEARRIVARQRV